MLVTVIIPCYNSAKYIAETIGSVQKQTHTDLELICVDNGSQDETCAIIKSFALQDSRIRLLHEPKKGANFARNLGIKNSSGIALQFLDSDDFLVPDKIELQLSKLLSDNADVVVSDRQVMDENLDLCLQKLTFEELEEDLLSVSIKKIISTGNPLFHRRAVNQVGGWDENLTSAQDWDFNIRMALTCKKIIYMPGSFYYSRKLNSSLSSDWIQVNENSVKVLNTHRSIIMESNAIEDKEVQKKIFFSYFISAIYSNRKQRIYELGLWGLQKNGTIHLSGLNKIICMFIGLKGTILIRSLYPNIRRMITRKKMIRM